MVRMWDSAESEREKGSAGELLNMGSDGEGLKRGGRTIAPGGGGYGQSAATLAPPSAAAAAAAASAGVK